jgi:hypothetical protein
MFTIILNQFATDPRLAKGNNLSVGIQGGPWLAIRESEDRFDVASG